MLFLYDLAGIACAGGDASIPEAYRVPTASAAGPCDHYDPDQVDTLFFFPDSPLRMSSDAATNRRLRTTWLKTVVNNPAAYLSHRIRVFAGVLGLHGEGLIWFVVHAMLHFLSRVRPCLSVDCFFAPASPVVLAIFGPDDSRAFADSEWCAHNRSPDRAARPALPSAVGSGSMRRNRCR